MAASPGDIYEASAVDSDRSYRQFHCRIETTDHCRRCGGAHVVCDRDADRRPAYVCPNCATPRTADGKRYVPPEMRQYSHHYPV